MSTRNEYIDQLKKNLDLWNDELARWEAKAKVARTDLRIDYEMQLETLRQQRDDAVARLKELQASSGEAWKELAQGADVAWAAMRESFDKAMTHFQK
jgi:cell division septum initiation protein DivIVA